MAITFTIKTALIMYLKQVKFMGKISNKKESYFSKWTDLKQEDQLNMYRSIWI